MRITLVLTLISGIYTTTIIQVKRILVNPTT